MPYLTHTPRPLPTWLSVCLAVAALAFTFLCVSAGVAMMQLRQAIIEMEDPHTGVLAILAHSGSSLQQAVVAEVDKALSRSVDALVKTANTQGDKARIAAVRSINNTSKRLSDQLTNTRTELALQLSDTNKNVEAATQSLVRLSGSTSVLASDLDTGVKQVNAQLPLWFDCESSPSCAYNLFQGFAKSNEKIAQVIATHAPTVAAAIDAQSANTTAITANVAEITKDAAIMTHNIVKPQPWWRRALGVVRDMSIFARLLE